MKRAYTKPVLQLESFVPQEYVAICFNMYCDADQYNSNHPAPNGNTYYWKDNEGTAADGYAQTGQNVLNTHGYYCIDCPTIYNDKTGLWKIDDTSGNGIGLIDRTSRNDNLMFWVKEGNDYKSYTLDQWTSIKNSSNIIVSWTETDASDGNQWNHVGHLVLNGNKHS